MPKIRSITYFGNLAAHSAEATLQRAASFLGAATAAFAEHCPVQTRRFAGQPFPYWIANPDQVATEGQRVFGIAQALGIDYVSLGPVGPDDDPAYAEAIPSLFVAQPGVFATVNIGDQVYGLSFEMVRMAARLIDTISRITPDGMANLYLAALANCPPGSPFFPVAYHDGGEPMFALAIQAADLAVTAFADRPAPTLARQRLTDAIQHLTDTLTPIAHQLAHMLDVRFGGFDVSLAPYPVDQESLGGALESLAGPFGEGGLVTAASVVMSAIELADFERIGFCGLMLPVLEDSVLAARAAEGRLTIQDLLLLSTICGTGLDCIPLAGDIGTTVLETLLLDVGALALRLNKPLTARLMPFPNKHAGDALAFDFEFFANSVVMDVASGRGFNAATDKHFPIVSRC